MTSVRDRTAAPEELDLLALSKRGPVHFVGIAGAGMATLAELVLRTGGRASGCDLNPGEAGAALRALGAEVTQGHDPAHVTGAVAVVTTAAVPREHPELRRARELGLPVLKRAAALGALVNRGTVIGIAGTHGKTTTTAMATAILDAAGLNPTGFVGGRVPRWGSGLRPGSDELFVVEADEYDRSFLTLRPNVAVVTTLEADHLDVFGSLEAVEEAFDDFLTPVPADGLVAACIDDAGARRLLERHGTDHTLGYGTGEDATLRACDIVPGGRGITARIRLRGEELGELRLGLPGTHNLRNALGAVAASLHVGARFADAVRALSDFEGVARRFQHLGEAMGVIVIDDYAHHPTEIQATITAVRGAYPGRRIVAVFQPHLYTRTRDFHDAFGTTLRAADRVWVTDVYPAREAPIEGVTGELVVAAARRAGAHDVRYHTALDTLAPAVADTLEPGDVALCLGAGSITEVAHALYRILDARGGGS
ncbi:MAG: UDP-N-acetylmuramate--L-alanine ligase [Longimicrobiales bacterium]